MPAPGPIGALPVYGSGMLSRWRHTIDGPSGSVIRRAGLRCIEAGALILIVAILLPPVARNIGLGLAALGVLLARPPINRIPGFWWGAAFCTLQYATAFVRPFRVDVEAMAFTWALVAVVPFALASPLLRQRAIAVAGLLLIGIGALTLGQFLVGHSADAKPFHLVIWGERFGRVGGLLDPVPAANALVGLAAFLTVPAASLRVSVGNVRHFRIICLALIIFSQVRMAALALVAGVTMWLLSGNGRKRTYALIALPLGLLAAIAVFFVLDSERLLRALAGEDGRWPIWQAGLAVALEHPFIGAGPGDGLRHAFTANLPAENANEFGSGYLTLHNSYLTIAAAHGIPTLLCYLGWLGSMLWAMWRSHARSVARVAVATVTAILVLGMFDHFAGRGGYHLGALLALACCLALCDEPKEDQHG